MREVAGHSIAQLEREIARIEDRASLLALCDALERDPRRGAQSLGTRTRRRVEAQARELERVSALFALRGRLLEQGSRHVAGVDEVGVGPLAGPVVAAAVVLPEVVDLPGLNDSKQLSAAARERLDALVRAQALAVSVAEVSHHEIDHLGILPATLEAMRRAVLGLTATLELDHLLVDARTIPGLRIRQTAIIRGDALDGSIAAASIVAKVHRDALMAELDARHPGYGFHKHKGYGTAEHLAALDRLGACPIHRRSFAPVAAAPR